MTAVSEFARTSSTNGTTAASADSLDSDVPTIDTPALERSKPRLRKVRDVYFGTEKIRDGGTEYVPQFSGESESGYEARKTIAGFFNGFARTVQAVVGWLCEPEPVLGEDMPEDLVAMWENVDGAGMHGAVFTRHLATAAIVDGFAGIFVDHTRADDPRIDRSKASLAASLALETGGELDSSDARAMGLRPYFILVKVDECLPVYEIVSGRRTLVMFIRKQVTSERKGRRFGFSPVTFYHVHELRSSGVWYERWVTRDGAARATLDPDVKPQQIKNVTGIPWSPFATGEKLGDHEYKPAMLDLADLAITHHRIATGILSLEEKACVVTPVRVGVVPSIDGEGNATYPELVLGPENTIEVPGGTGASVPVYYLSPAVDVLDPAMKSLDTNKAEQGSMGASFLTPEPQQQETATAHVMDASAERANIGTWSRGLGDCIEGGFGWAGQYIKKDAGSVSVNKDFTGTGVDVAMATVMMTAFQNGVIEDVDLRHFLKTGQLPETFDPANMAGVLKQGALRAIAERKAMAEANANADATGDGGANA